MAKETIPSYDDVDVDKESIEEIEDHIDSGFTERRYTGGNGEDDGISTPEALGTVLTKYRVQAEIPYQQKKDFDINKAFHGRHVALSNTRRMDNIRHLDAQDLCNIYERIPTMRHRATKIRMRETGEFQMCRSNPEVGGFEAKIAATSIRKEDVDVRQTQNLASNSSKKKKNSFLSFLGKNKGG